MQANRESSCELTQQFSSFSSQIYRSNQTVFKILNKTPAYKIEGSRNATKAIMEKKMVIPKPDS